MNGLILINVTSAFWKRRQDDDLLPHVLVVPQFYVIPFYSSQSSIYIVDYMRPHDMAWQNKIKLIIVFCVGTPNFILSVWEH